MMKMLNKNLTSQISNETTSITEVGCGYGTPKDPQAIEVLKEPLIGFQETNLFCIIWVENRMGPRSY